MGMQQTVTFPGDVPSWSAVRDVLAGVSLTPQMRMIDNELAFPDEEPSPAWRELRVALFQGMVTVRRGPGRVEVVTWGNADPAMRQGWNALTWAFAAAGGGRIETPGGPLSADAFRETAELPEAVRQPKQT